MRAAILGVLADGVERTRKELWESLPAGVRANEVRFKSVIETMVGTAIAKSGSGARGHPYQYRIAAGWVSEGNA